MSGYFEDGYRTARVQTRRGYRKSKSAIERTFEDNPLALGLGVLAAGVFTGLVLPATPYEDQYLGGAADDVREHGYELGKQALAEGQHTAALAARTALQEARNQGLSPDQLAEKARRIVADVESEVGHAVKAEGLDPQSLARKAGAVGQQAKHDVEDGAAKVADRAEHG